MLDHWRKSVDIFKN